MPRLTAAGVRFAKPGSHSDGNGIILRVSPTGGNGGSGEEPYREDDGTLALAPTPRSRSEKPEPRRWNTSGLLEREATPRLLDLQFRPSSKLPRRSYNFTGPNGSREADPRISGGHPSPTMCSQ